jgi:hypothetical protein
MDREHPDDCGKVPCKSKLLGMTQNSSDFFQPVNSAVLALEGKAITSGTTSATWLGENFV